MNLSDLDGRRVLDLTTATTVGTVADVVIDPATRRIVGFHLAGVKGPACWLSWDATNALGADDGHHRALRRAHRAARAQSRPAAPTR